MCQRVATRPSSLVARPPPTSARHPPWVGRVCHFWRGIRIEMGTWHILCAYTTQGWQSDNHACAFRWLSIKFHQPQCASTHTHAHTRPHALTHSPRLVGTHPHHNLEAVSAGYRHRPSSAANTQLRVHYPRVIRLDVGDDFLGTKTSPSSRLPLSNAPASAPPPNLAHASAAARQPPQHEHAPQAHGHRQFNTLPMLARTPQVGAQT